MEEIYVPRQLSAEDSMRFAIRELKYVIDEYKSMQTLDEDAPKTKKVSFSWETEEQQGERQTTWESMLDSLNASYGKLNVREINEKRMTYELCHVRKELVRILGHCADNRPWTLAAARRQLQRLKEDFENALAVADILGRGKITTDNTRIGKFHVAPMQPTIVPWIHELSLGTPDKQHWPMAKFHSLLEKSSVSARVIKMHNSPTPHQVVAYHIAEYCKQYDGFYIEKVVTVIDAGATQVRRLENHEGPGVVEATLADVLRYINTDQPPPLGDEGERRYEKLVSDI